MAEDNDLFQFLSSQPSLVEFLKTFGSLQVNQPNNKVLWSTARKVSK
jgi:hypothetical protein